MSQELESVKIESSHLTDDCEPTMLTELTEDDPLSLPSQLSIKTVSSIAANQAYKFKRRLVLQVRRQRRLYDTLDKQFGSDEAKQEAWLIIAKTLKTDVDVCRNTWADVRFEYQRYSRRLRKFFRSGNKNGKRRPIMALESELLFLWRFVADKSFCSHSFVNIEEEEAEAAALAAAAAETTDIETTDVVVAIDDDDDDDLVMLEDTPIVVIDLDDEESYKKPPPKSERSCFVITKEARKLAELIKVYPELYDSKHRSFTDYKRKGIIWNAIANDMSDKATKLMKWWIHMQTRYEWELNQPNVQHRNADMQTDNESELEKLLKFMQSHIMENPNTVYKQSFYLRKRWHEPIEHFKNIYNLLAIMKKFPQALSFTCNLITTENKDKYQSIWHDISKCRACPAGQCETTWIILRTFYWELMNMRKQSYQLQDKWYFESIITELYMHADVLMRPPTLATPVVPPLATVAADDAASTSSTSASVPPTTVLVSLDEDMISSTTITTKRAHSAVEAVDANNSANIIKMPKIMSAKSLAPTPATVANLSASKSLLKISQKPLRVGTKPSGNSLNMVKLPYHLPEHTKVIPLSAQGEPGDSSSVRLLTQRPVVTVMPTTHLFNMTPVVTSAASISSATTSSFSSVRPKTLMTYAASSAITARPKTPVSTVAAIAAASPSDTMTMPKITGALSLLNPNEIMIELIGSSNGNQLVVHGPPLSEKFSLSMTKTALFIREVMAIPLLHNKQHNQPERINTYWQYLSTKFQFPTHICKACWNFLSENFTHFPQIAPMDELMKPFKSSIKVWYESKYLFSDFDSNAVKMGCLSHQAQLPDLMEEIRIHPCLYKDLPKLPDNAPIPDDRNQDFVWHTIRLKFSDIKKLREIWVAFKDVFNAYMCDLERGIDNKWPLNWWRVLAKMMFLVEVRYHSKEAFYYIVRNKINEEIERCNLIEVKKGKQLKVTDYFANNSTSIVATPQTQQTTTDASESGPSTSLNALRLQTRPDIDAYALILAIRRHPDIYQKCESSKKLNAWSEVAIEMNTSVSACRLTFQHALKTYRTHKACDPSERCDISQRYFKHFDAIYSAVKAKKSKLNIKTPWELNQSVDNQFESKDLNCPEKYIVDINMTNNKPALVMKNWSFAIGTLRPEAQKGITDNLRALFNKYRPLAAAAATPVSH